MTESPLAARHRGRLATSWSDGTPIDQVRFVVLDLETTGLNPTTDAIVTIGAVGVVAGEIRLDDSYAALLKVTQNSSAVTVHGVTRDQSVHGLEETVAIERFLDFLGDGVIVGHHIGHDITALDTACTKHWGFTLRNRRLDTMDLSLHLERGGRLCRSAGLPSLHAGRALRTFRRHPPRSAHRGS